MSLSRRHLLQCAAGAAIAPAFAELAGAQARYPARPVRVVIGYPAGGSADTVARLVCQSLSDRLGQPFIIDNRPGAGTNIATEAVAKSPPDGYTLLYITTANAMNASLYDRLTFNFLRDITPIASTIHMPLVLEVSPSFPARTVPDLIAHAKKNPGKITIASTGVGGPQHISYELFKMLTGVQMVHVPYRGSGPALTDLISDRVDVFIDALPSSIEFIKTGKVIPLAVTTAQRVELLPDLPLLKEFLPGYESAGWQGFGAPTGTPPEIITLLNAEINRALADPKIKSVLLSLSNVVVPGTPAEFRTFLVAETDKWGKVVKFAGIKPQ